MLQLFYFYHLKHLDFSLVLFVHSLDILLSDVFMVSCSRTVSSTMVKDEETQCPRQFKIRKLYETYLEVEV